MMFPYRALFSACVASATVCPLTHVLDVAVVKSATSHDVIGSIFQSMGEFTVDQSSLLGFTTMFFTLFTSNVFKKGVYSVELNY